MSVLKTDRFIVSVTTVFVIAWMLMGVCVALAQSEQELDGLVVDSELGSPDSRELALAAWDVETSKGQPAVLLLEDDGGDGEWLATLEIDSQSLTGLLEEGDRIRGEVDLMRRLRLASRTSPEDTDLGIVIERSIVATLHADTGPVHLVGEMVRITSRDGLVTRAFLPVALGSDVDELAQAMAAFSDVRALRRSREVSSIAHKEVDPALPLKHEPGCPTGPTTGCYACYERYDDDISSCDFGYLGCTVATAALTIACLAACPTTGPFAGACAAACVAGGLAREAECAFKLAACGERARRDRDVCLQLC